MQLLLIPKSKEEFLTQLKLSAEWFKYGLQAVSHKQSIIMAENPFTIRIKTQESVILAAELKGSDKVADEKNTFVQKKDSLSEISINFSRKDIFILGIYAKRKADTGIYNYVGEYWIDVRNVVKSGKVFPMTFKAFYQHNCYLFNPLDIIANKGRKTQIEIHVPGAEKAAIVKDGKWIYLEKMDGDIFKGDIPNEKEGTIVYALFPGGKEFQALLKFYSF